MNVFSRFFLFAILAAGVVPLSGCHHATKQINSAADETKPVATVELANPSNFARNDEPLYLSFYDLGLTGPLELSFVVDGEYLPTQKVDSDGNGKVDGIFTVLDFTAGQIRKLTVVRVGEVPVAPSAKRTQAEISIKRGGKWVPRADSSGYKNYEGGEFFNVEQVTVPDYYTDHSNWIRYEGPGIESDRVGYRIYLDGRNGFDIFGKSIAEPVLQQIGLDGYESYHHPQSWGMDILKVGKSLGAGGFGYWDGEQLVPVQTVKRRSARIVENGDVHAGFTIEYEGWSVNDTQRDISAYFSIGAGSRLVKSQLTLDAELPNIAIGLVEHPDTQFIRGPENRPGDAYSYIATWGAQSLDGQNLGMAVFFRKGDNKEIIHDGSSHIALMKPAGGALTYYFAAAWAGENGGGIQDLEAFKRYLDQQAERLTRPLRRRLSTRLSEQTKRDLVRPLQWSRMLADAELARKTFDYRFDGWDANRKRKPKFEYDIVGLLPYAYDELAKATGEPSYAKVKSAVTASYIMQDGTIRQYDKQNFNIDSVAPGRALFRVYGEKAEQKYRVALDELRDQLRHQPKTHNGAFWHKQIYPGQLWLDGVYMGMPFLAEYAVRFESDKEQADTLDEIVHEFEVTRELLRDPKSGLYFHAWDEERKQNWADPKTGLSAHLWGRGNGWLAMALVDTLDLLPVSHQGRQLLLDMTADLAGALKNHQDPTGTWWQIMDKPGAVGNYRESSASAMFTYFFAKAANRGYLTEENFSGDLRETVLNSYRGLVSEFILVHANGQVSMTNQCHVAGLGFGRDGSYDYYMNEAVVANDPKGTVPFILAGIEVEKFMQNFQD
jgi:rhamnogalacturonyl hydrolase YesR